MNRRDLLRGALALPVAAAAAAAGIKATPRVDLTAKWELATAAYRSGIVSLNSVLESTGLSRFMLGGPPAREDGLYGWPETSGEAINNLVMSACVRYGDDE